MRNVGPIPQLGYGTWNHTGEAARRCVLDALEAGYRHIDTAEGYGNEAEVGAALAEGGVARGDIFLTTKVSPENLGPGKVAVSVRRSLDKLRVDQVDLLLVHWPPSGDQYAMDDYLAQFAAVAEAGLARHIGVSNFTRAHIDRAVELLGARVITTNQCEIHVFHANRAIVEHCAAKGIAMTAYCPLARGLVAKDMVIAEIAVRRGATPAQIAIAYLLHEGHVAIPSSGNRDRIIENWGARNLVLTLDEMERLRGLDRNQRLVDGAWCPKWD